MFRLSSNFQDHTQKWSTNHSSHKEGLARHARNFPYHETTTTMKLYNAFGVPLRLVYIVRVALLPTLREVFRAPWLLLHPIELSRLSMSFVWGLIGKGMDEACREIKTALITPHAHGVVLDIGAGNQAILRSIVVIILYLCNTL